MTQCKQTSSRKPMCSSGWGQKRVPCHRSPPTGSEGGEQWSCLSRRKQRYLTAKGKDCFTEVNRNHLIHKTYNWMAKAVCVCVCVWFVHVASFTKATVTVLLLWNRTVSFFHHSPARSLCAPGPGGSHLRNPVKSSRQPSLQWLSCYQ